MTCALGRSDRFHERAIVEISDVVLRTGVPESIEVRLLIFPTLCSDNRSPIIPESAFVEISDVLFCAQESQNI